jgi:hypothetical protein
MKKTKNQQSAAPSTETSTQSKVDEPYEERTQLLARHEELTRKMLQLKGQLEEIKRKREELRLNHPINSEKFQKILLNRYKVAQAAVSESYYLYSDMIVDTYKHACKLFSARLDATVTKWSKGVERHYTNVLGPIEQVNDAIREAGDSTTAMPVDLTGKPKDQDTTTTTDE